MQKFTIPPPPKKERKKKSFAIYITSSAFPPTLFLLNYHKSPLRVY